MYCIAIAKELVVATCPLEPGRCYWQHRENHRCAFTTDDLTPEQFAARVGVPAASEADFEIFKTKVKSILQECK